MTHLYVRSLIVAAAFALAAAPGFAAASPAIDITAVPSTFTPNSIVVKAGETTHLRFPHTSGVHGITAPELGVPKTTIEPGKTVDVAITPKKPGTYVVQCDVYCGPEHEHMTLTVKVVA